MVYSGALNNGFNDNSNVGSFDKNNPNVGTGLVGAPACGDVMKLQILVQNGKITDCKFKTFGCGAAIAASAKAAELIKNRTLEEALELKNTQIIDILGLPPVKHHCSVLAEAVLRAALEDFRKKQKEFLTITNSAAEYLQSFAAQKIKDPIFLLQVDPYVLDCADLRDDLQSVTVHGITIMIDKAAELNALGMTIDYEVHNDWSGLTFKTLDESACCMNL